MIQAQDLRTLLAQQACLVFDVRHDLADHQAGRRAYSEGHIPRALFLDTETQLSAARSGHNGRHPLPDRHDFAALMRTQGLTSRTRAVVYDAGDGLFASRLWWMLRWLGHASVSVLDGGWRAWVEAGGEVETGMRNPALTEAQAVQGLALSGKPSMPAVDANEVLAGLDQEHFTLIDARSAQRYRGEVEPLDPAAGHIPGALNRPYQSNLQPDGRFKPADTLQAEFQTLLGDQAGANVVHQCGSGISACHNLLAMELAGLHGSALYPGSWSEWCSDPSRPVATGA
ncbi:MAG: sulfurtransferase [Alcaligenaceae bacterium]|nr:sulfurtransferase [Alcaligenaceae bacterium]